MAPTPKSAGRAATRALICPECGRTFERPASLGAHRRRAHGVAGSSRPAGKRTRAATRSSSTAARAATSRRPKATQAQTPAAATTKASARSTRRRAVALPPSRSRNGSAALDRDALLRTLFPNGVPARESALKAVSAWLDEAERLTRMR